MAVILILIGVNRSVYSIISIYLTLKVNHYSSDPLEPDSFFGHFGDWAAFFLLSIRQHLKPGEVFQKRSVNVTDESRGGVGDE